MGGDDVAGHEPVVVVTHALWQRALGRDASVVGKRIALNGITYTLAGVLPATWEDPGMVDGIAPPDVFRASPPYFSEASRDGFSFSAVARSGRSTLPTQIWPLSQTLKYGARNNLVLSFGRAAPFLAAAAAL